MGFKSIHVLMLTVEELTLKQLTKLSSSSSVSNHFGIVNNVDFFVGLKMISLYSTQGNRF